MSGDDGLTLPFMSAGATGVISVASNLVVAPLVQMVEAAQKNDYATARKIFLNYHPLFKALFIEPNPVPIKYALQCAGIISNDSVRSPLYPLSASTREILNSLLENYGLVD
jgi:4-hydroxy-tetrahydrodipicolinate synthase